MLLVQLSITSTIIINILIRANNSLQKTIYFPFPSLINKFLLPMEINWFIFKKL